MFTNAQMERFWKNVEIGDSSGCWNWKLSVDRYGYGKAKIGGVVYISHRVAFWMWNGKSPAGLEVMHICDNPRCCNPEHLKIGSHRDNMQDMIKKGRQGHGYVNNTKLNQRLADSIRAEFASGVSKHYLSKSYGVSTRHIRSVLRGVFWRQEESK